MSVSCRFRTFAHFALIESKTNTRENSRKLLARAALCVYNVVAKASWAVYSVARPREEFENPITAIRVADFFSAFLFHPLCVVFPSAAAATTATLSIAGAARLINRGKENVCRRPPRPQRRIGKDSSSR